MKQWEKKELVRGLRSQGLSYKEIRERIPFTIAKSTISDWCKDIELTTEQKDRLDKLFKDGSYRGRLLGPKATQVRREKEIAEIKEKAKLEIISLTENEFKLAGLMLYWAEGNKTEFVGFSNSEPKIVRFMVEWFKRVCGVPIRKIKAYLNLHSGQNENQIKKFWTNVTGLSISQFGKSYIKKEGTGHRKNILYNGTIRINIYNSNLLHKILGWIEAIKLPA
jgi:DNA-binding transcriptional MerR regulator